MQVLSLVQDDARDDGGKSWFTEESTYKP
jgi:hypothetical protein